MTDPPLADPGPAPVPVITGPKSEPLVDRDRPSWMELIAFGLVSRVVVVALGCLLAWFGPTPQMPPKHIAEDPLGRGSAVGSPTAVPDFSVNGRRWVEPWYRWDARWYARISMRGYEFAEGRHSSAAFFPLLPVIMVAGARAGLDPFWVGLIAPNLAFALGLGCFGKIARKITGDTAAAWHACMLLVAFPTSFFFSAPYQESLAFALSCAAVLAWLEHRPVLAAAALALGTTARLTVCTISAALILGWAEDVIRRRPARHSAWAVAIVGGLGILLFYSYLALRFGDFFAQLHAMQAWGRGSPSLANLLKILRWPADGFIDQHFGYVAMIVFLALGVRAWWRRGAFWGGLILLPLLQPMSSGLSVSMSRYVLAAFPAFVEAGELLRNRFAFTAVTTIFWLLQLIAILFYIHFVFVG
jgi:hypothetical protein